MLSNKDHINAQRRQRYKQDPERFQNQRLKHLYKIEALEYQRLHEQQEGLCKLCGLVCITGRRLSVDHNHQTGAIRGLLCGNCNQGLGKFQDNIDLLEKAITYLKENNVNDSN